MEYENMISKQTKFQMKIIKYLGETCIAGVGEWKRREDGSTSLLCRRGKGDVKKKKPEVEVLAKSFIGL